MVIKSSSSQRIEIINALLAGWVIKNLILAIRNYSFYRKKPFLLKKIEESGNHARAIQKIYRQYLEVPLAKFMLKNPQSEISVKISESLVIFE